MKHKIITLLTVAMLSLAANDSSAQVTVNDVNFPAQLSKESESLVLNGAGIRTKYFFKVYVAGLYLPKKTKDASAIVHADEPMAIRLVVTSGLIDSENFSESTRDGFNKSLDGKTAPLQKEIDNFINILGSSEIKEGDTYDLWYFPEKGVTAYKNGKVESITKGLPFKMALFGIWLSDNPVDEDLKEELLGE